MKNYPTTPLPLRTRAITRKLVGDIPINYRNKMLAVGAGDGSELVLFAPDFKKIKGIDFSTRVVKLATKNTRSYSNISIRKQDLFDARDTFDTCLMLAVLEHIRDDIKALSKIKSLLKKKGYLLLGVPAHKKLYNLHDQRVGHFRRYEKKELLKKLKTSGFEIKVFKTIGFPVGNIIYFVYNLVLRFSNDKILEKKQSMIQKTKTTAPGTEDKMVKGLYFLNYLSPFITKIMIFFDQFFLDTNLGLYYIVLARKK